MFCVVLCPPTMIERMNEKRKKKNSIAEQQCFRFIVAKILFAHLSMVYFEWPLRGMTFYSHFVCCFYCLYLHLVSHTLNSDTFWFCSQCQLPTSERQNRKTTTTTAKLISYDVIIHFSLKTSWLHHAPNWLISYWNSPNCNILNNNFAKAN